MFLAVCDIVAVSGLGVLLVLVCGRLHFITDCSLLRDSSYDKLSCSALISWGVCL